MPAAPQATRQLGHEPALDGIRGIAVLIVVAWHYPSDILERPFAHLKAGHLGVDLFFVLSGFLITALMLSESGRSGNVDMRAFYRRRVFRLLPALAVFLAAHVVWAAITDIDGVGLSPGTEMDAEIASVTAATFFALNWLGEFSDHQITLGLAHLWSLSVEEQFYLVWPGLVVAMLAPRAAIQRIPSTIAVGAAMYSGHIYVWDDIAAPARWAATLTLGAALLFGLEQLRRIARPWWIIGVVVTAIAAVLLYRNGRYEGGFEIFHLYAATTSRADSLLVGAGLAFLWTYRLIPKRGPVWLGVIGWCVLTWAITTRTFAEPFFFRYGWTVIALAGAAILWAAIDAGDSWYGRVLSMRWLRSIGKVAYGLYLWHALVFIAVRHWWGDGSVLWKTFLALGITAAVTVASWVLVERPMLRYKARRTTPASPVATGESSSASS